ncbi:hypothetical protein Poli38472_000581 [Pythium oligandrum]|uniref:Cyclopropane-fatty-acyl-phospholipid synthase n=1 Tax=Pythium oligandrum TaxID=41045 RepID=A0A8K1FH04_PYTOL|nr:hypothetical protein Poli38472_000581 [Pythium oligandrum]|eukprot:TMW60539.1 hypothetical protein Poli38472_000581 [Pythium oligandrum]
MVDLDVDAVRLDAVLAVTLLFAVVIIPSLMGVRLMYTMCWLLFSLLALLVGSDAALGIATTMGITIMVGWYALRVFDRGLFRAGLRGWLGVWANSSMVGFIVRVGDALVHLVLSMILISFHLPLVRVWMSIPALVASRLWVHFAVGGGTFPKGDHVFRFDPPRSQHFWNAAYRLELVLNLCIPVFCVLAHQGSFWVYAATALGGITLVGLRIIRSLSLKKLRLNAKEIMLRLLAAGGLQSSTDIVAHDDAIWLDWMRDGLIAIGETYMGGLWEPATNRSLDEMVTALMTIPMEARQEMYRSWAARLVALAARIFNYPPSSKGHVVGSASEQFDLSPEFREGYMDSYFYHGFGLWSTDTRTIEESQTRKLANIAEVLDLQAGQRVLDLCLGSWGGVGTYLAEHHPEITVMCLLTSTLERVHASRFAEERGVLDRIEFIVLDSPDKLLTTLSSISASRFDRIVGCGVVEALEPSQLPRFFRTIKRIQVAGGCTLLDVVACPALRSTIHAWSNKYINGGFPAHAITLTRTRDLFERSGFTIHEIVVGTHHFERTFTEWHRQFQVHWGVTEVPAHLRERRPSQPPPMRTSALPLSFRRTWEFYLLHNAACFRAQVLQVYQVRVS